MPFLDGVYVDHPNGTARFRWVKALTSQELTQLAHTIAHRVGRFLERQGLLERDAENSYLASDAVDDVPMTPLVGLSITYRIAEQGTHKELIEADGLYSRLMGRPERSRGMPGMAPDTASQL